MVGVFFVRCVGYCYCAQEDDGGARMEKLEKRPDTVLDIFLVLALLSNDRCVD